MAKAYDGPIVTQDTGTSPNESVPRGHRTKCRSCGAVDSTKLVGSRRLVRCAFCGSVVAKRRAPRKPNVISFVVLTQHDGINVGSIPCTDRFAAERTAITWCERGPVARTRVAMVVELLDDIRTGNVQVLRYENFRGRRTHTEWTGGCEACKGKGTVAVRLPAQAGEKVVVKFIACVSCSGLGGQLNREVNYRRLRA